MELLGYGLNNGKLTRCLYREDTKRFYKLGWQGRGWNIEIT